MGWRLTPPLFLDHKKYITKETPTFSLGAPLRPWVVAIINLMTYGMFDETRRALDSFPKGLSVILDAVSCVKYKEYK